MTTTKKHAPWQIGQITDRIGNMRGYANEGDITALQREYAVAVQRLLDNYTHWVSVAQSVAADREVRP